MAEPDEPIPGRRVPTLHTRYQQRTADVLRHEPLRSGSSDLLYLRIRRRKTRVRELVSPKHISVGFARKTFVLLDLCLVQTYRQRSRHRQHQSKEIGLHVPALPSIGLNGSQTHSARPSACYHWHNVKTLLGKISG